MKLTTSKELDPIERRMQRGRRVARVVTCIVLLAVGVTALLKPDLFSAQLSMPSEQERAEAKKQRQKKQSQKPRRRLSKLDVERLAKLREERARKQMMEMLRRLEQRIVLAEKEEAAVTARFRKDPALFDSLLPLLVEHSDKVYGAIRKSRMQAYGEKTSVLHQKLKQLEPVAREVQIVWQFARRYQSHATEDAFKPLAAAVDRLTRVLAESDYTELLGQQALRYGLSIQSNVDAIRNQDRDMAVRGFAQPEDHPLSASQRAQFDRTIRPMTMAELHQLSQLMAEHYKNLMGDVAAGELADAAEIPFPVALDKLAHEPYAKDDMQEELQQEMPENVDQLDQFTEALTEAQMSAARALMESGGEMPGQGEGEQADGGEGQGGDKSGDAKFGDGPFGSGGGNGTENSNQQGDPSGPGQRSREAVWRSLALRSDLAASQDRSRQITVNKKKVLANVLPGRRFSSQSERKGYLFIDTWHIIGPWDAQATRGRQIDFSKIYPLEKKVDLDAIYTTGKRHFLYDDERGYAGKDERSGRLRWQFYQSPTVEVRIPREQLSNDALYFAYTEVYFEQETTMNLAIASDDAARIRVNGKIVFEDAGLSPYEISEQVRVVKFKRGVNKILVRLVNGPGPCRFSLLLIPKT
ncbi:hypothetical protein HW115_12270 [Verrucomicrobiaceae bacterium N1E253]|uniref:Uncharacterized protein n=1 Tax=Oceaniferula marina TaxID=2748318 RepID=A0A851GNI6_9BACT|nr:hypothetical protein [Oceaniferula marina]NWK56390.1 hypothetical protein [Oceaniferula marina]